MFELDAATTAAALRELALEDEAALDGAVDRTVDWTADRAHGRTVTEVETILRAWLRHEGLDLGNDTAQVAKQIVEAVNQLRPIEPAV